MGYTYEELKQKFSSVDEYNNIVKLEEYNSITFKNRLGETKILGKLIYNEISGHIIFAKSTLNALHIMNKYNKSIGINYNIFKELKDDDAIYFEYKSRKKSKSYGLFVSKIKKYGIIDSPDKNTLEKQIFMPLKYWQKL